MSHQAGHETTTISQRLARLERVMGTDEGLYVVGLHAFIESCIIDVCPEVAYEREFRNVIDAYRYHLQSRQQLSEDARHLLKRITVEHSLTNRVRHQFRAVDPEEARAVTHNFVRFCGLMGIDPKILAAFDRGLTAWEDKTSPLQKSQELQRMRYGLQAAQRENEKLLDQLGEYNGRRQEAVELEARGRAIEAELETERQRGQARRQRVDELRAELNDARMEQRAVTEKLAEYERLERYVEYLDRFSLYTRTRLDYERSVLKLTPEQEDVAQRADLRHHFLIKGGAGTGKTLVLLRTLERVLQDRESDLGFAQASAGQTVLLTYTTTLVKYDRYLSQIMSPGKTADLITTADSYLLGKLRTVDPGCRVDYRIVSTLSGQLNDTDFFTSEELAVEIEELIFGNSITREEYVDQRISRRGMRQPLSQAQRRAVWRIREAMVERMDRDRTYSKNYARIRLATHLEDPVCGTRLADARTIFVDESQDLSSGDLRVLRLLAQGAVIMAGDTDQSIYGIWSPYARAGLEITGRTRVLKTNFRNTCAIHDLAESYRANKGGGRFDDTTVPRAFREGPAPEPYVAPSAERLRGLLVSKVRMYVETLGYDPENVTVLAPTNAEVDMVQDALRTVGFTSANIRGQEFSFEERGIIRLSTLHSSKGLDFPVVLLYLPFLNTAEQYDERAADSLARNLIYVAMTRAMDNLSVFLPSEPKEACLRDLLDLMRSTAADATPQETGE